METTSTCSARNKEGKPCRARPLHGKTTCILHSDSNAARQFGRIGGLQRVAATRPVFSTDFTPPKDLEELRTMVSMAIAATMTGKMQPKTANAIGTLASTFSTILRATNLKERIEALESWRQRHQGPVLFRSKGR